MSPSVFTKVPFDFTGSLDMLDARILNLTMHKKQDEKSDLPKLPILLRRTNRPEPQGSKL